MIKILIDADIIPQARPRVTRCGRTYFPKRNQDFRRIVQTCAMAAMKGAEPLKGEICAVFKVYRKWRRTARQAGDVDNLSKSLMDGMNGIVFEDDSQICRLTIEKFQDKERPRAEIIIGEIDEANFC